MKRTREDQPASSYPNAGPASGVAAAGGAAGGANSPSPTASRAPPQPVRATATVAPPAAGMPKVQDALGYLDKVKSTYSHNPQVYNHFLDIMKDFKSMAIDTEGVIKRVKSLFVGHRALIQGFNQFLPPGYKIDADSVAATTPAAASPAGGATAAKPVTPANAAGSPSNAAAAGATAAKPATPASSAPGGAAPAAGSPGAAAANAALVNKPTVEFNHAVNYVAKIKHRFRDQPAIYSEFLDILHDYQAKRTIEEVYHRVQKLFGNEPDLLSEFRYFLPENPAAQSKPAAAQGGGSGAKRPAPGGMNSKGGGGSAVKKSGSNAVSAASSASKPGEESKASRLVSSAQQRVQGKQQSASSKAPPNKKGDKQPQPSGSSKGGKDKGNAVVAAGPVAAAVIKPALTYPPGSEAELGMMDRLHHTLSRSQWAQFLKCLNLFACDIVSRMEMVRMVEDLLLPAHQHHDAHMAELFERFKAAIAYNEWDEKALITAQHSNYYTFVASVDFTTCPQVTPSYRQLPAAVSTLYCSGRTALCEAVLNDKCISIPTGSEDFSFKATRKNVYEENLFKVEDERFELDMIIENNAAVIRVLEPLVESVQNMAPEQARHVTLNENLDILHLRSISRVYGESGYEMIELLKTCPALTAKVVLERLHQKDEEWRRVRGEMKNVWRRISEQNYQRSLDHRSFYFKQEDKKRRAPKALVTELREVHNRVFELSAGMEEGEDDIFAGLRPGIEESVMLRQIRQGHTMKPLLNAYCMHFQYEDDAIHRRMRELLVRVARDVFKYSEREVCRLEQFMLGFVWLFFGVDVREDEWREVDRLEREVREREEKGEVDGGGEGGAADMEGVEEEEGEDGGEEGRGLSGKVRKRGAQAVDGMEVESDAGSVAVGAKAVAAAKGRKKGKAKQVRNRNRQGQQRPKDELKEEEEEEEKEDEVEVDVEGGSGRLERSSSAAASVASGGDKKHGGGKEEEKAQDSADEEEKPRMSPTPASAATSSAHSIAALARDILAAHLSLPPPSPIKPITLAPSTFQLDNALHPPRTHSRPSHLFYGSHAYYVFFRLHQFLYDRLHTAKALAHKTRRVSQKKKLPATGEERWARFNTLLDEFVRGEGEGKGESRFEDECRNLLGASSYVLFTMDKVIHQCLKQVVALLNSDVSMQLLQLYAQETRRAKQEREKVAARGGGERELEELSGRLCRQYQYQCQLILNNDNLTQLEYFSDTRELGIGLCEGLSISDGSSLSGSSHDATLGGKVSAWHGDSDKQQADGREWRDYMERFVYGAVREEDERTAARAGRLWLRRNVSRVKAQRGGSGRAGVRTSNGLELKVCMKTYRLIFVEGSGDVAWHWPRPPLDEEAARRHGEARDFMFEYDEARFNELVPDYVPPPAQQPPQTTLDEQDDEVMAVSEAALGDGLAGEAGEGGEGGAGEGDDEEGGLDGDAQSDAVSVSASPSPAPGGQGGQGGALFSAVAAAQQSAEANAGSPSPTPTPTSPADDVNGV